MVGRGPFKRQALKVLVQKTIPIATIIDIGVLSGTPELMEAFPKTQHILFEPVSEFHKRIRKNYAKLDYRLIEAAVTDQDRDVTLHVRKVFHRPRSATRRSLMRHRTTAKPALFQARASYFTKANALAKPYLVKIDVDGNEMKIFPARPKR